MSRVRDLYNILKWTLGFDLYSKVPRPMTLFLKEKFGKQKLIGAEIGVFEGINAESICKTLNICKLYLVDSYVGYTEDGLHVNLASDVEQKARLRLAKLPVLFIRKTSIEATSLVPNCLDFVYIDGNHDLARQDLEMYYPKVKIGGVIGGHDFSLERSRSLVCGIVRFAFERRLQLYGKSADWWLVKTS